MVLDSARQCSRAAGCDRLATGLRSPVVPPKHVARVGNLQPSRAMSAKARGRPGSCSAYIRLTAVWSRAMTQIAVFVIVPLSRLSGSTASGVVAPRGLRRPAACSLSGSATGRTSGDCAAKRPFCLPGARLRRIVAASVFVGCTLERHLEGSGFKKKRPWGRWI